ncbi:MAG: class I SAM-dependent methyltransferase family protein, partial [Candidatus Aenigmarchaeota archaeon]|nr:class I SAM-dependent methyltransferase family protein [Candidatus Aenigmarchaeota archaeon]
MERTRAYDVVGDIAIVEIDDNAEFNEIAKSIMGSHKNIKVVLRKVSERIGTHRTRTYAHLAGERRTTTVHKESG